MVLSDVARHAPAVTPSRAVDRDPSGAQLRAALLIPAAGTAPPRAATPMADVPLLTPLSQAVAMSGAVTLAIGLLRIATA